MKELISVLLPGKDCALIVDQSLVNLPDAGQSSKELSMKASQQLPPVEERFPE